MRWAKANQPKEHKEQTHEDRFHALMSHHKEDLARRLLLVEPIEAEEAVKELQEVCKRHVETIDAMSRELSTAREAMGLLRRTNDRYRLRNSLLLQELNAAKEGKA